MTVWDRLFTTPQQLLTENDTAYPVVHCIYRQRDDGRFERLCDRLFAGQIHEIRETPPTDAPISETWYGYGMLGNGFSCAKCASIAHGLAGTKSSVFDCPFCDRTFDLDDEQQAAETHLDDCRSTARHS